jgi:ribonuclease HII
LTLVVGGVDEAGRGCVAGALVVAGASIRKDRVAELVRLGVKDSKMLSPRRRESVYAEILRSGARVSLSRIQPAAIDEVVRRGQKYRKLNFLEAVHMAKVIDRLGAHEVLVDASDTVPSRFAEDIRSQMRGSCRVTARHHADREDPLVSAASIVAKVNRDRAAARLRSRYGDFGSGYPSDPKTRMFMQDWLSAKGRPPPFMRASWKTWERLRALREATPPGLL